MFNFTVGLVNMIKSNKKIIVKKTKTVRKKCTKKRAKGSFSLQR